MSVDIKCVGGPADGLRFPFQPNARLVIRAKRTGTVHKYKLQTQVGCTGTRLKYRSRWLYVGVIEDEKEGGR